MLDISEYIKDISTYPLLTPKEEREIAVKARSGDREAQEKLVTGNPYTLFDTGREYGIDKSSRKIWTR